MEMVIEFKEEKISNLILNNGEIHRVQFFNVDDYDRFCKKEAVSSNGTMVNLYNWGVKMSRKKVLTSFTPKELLSKFLSASEIKEFEELMYPNETKMELPSSFDKKILKLPKGDRMIIFLKLFLLHNDLTPFLICTGGMHVPNLKLTYSLISTFLSKGGKCVELTYPIMKEDDFKEVIGATPKIINYK